MTEFSIIGGKVSKILPKFSKILDQTWGHFRDVHQLLDKPSESVEVAPRGVLEITSRNFSPLDAAMHSPKYKPRILHRCIHYESKHCPPPLVGRPAHCKCCAQTVNIVDTSHVLSVFNCNLRASANLRLMIRILGLAKERMLSFLTGVWGVKSRKKIARLLLARIYQ